MKLQAVVLEVVQKLLSYAPSEAEVDLDEVSAELGELFADLAENEGSADAEDASPTSNG